MKYFVAAVRDDAVGVFSPPIYARSHGEAIRSFQDACNDPNSNLYRHSKDYHLFHLGEWDDNSATHDLLDAPNLLASAFQMILKDITK